MFVSFMFITALIEQWNDRPEDLDPDSYGAIDRDRAEVEMGRLLFDAPRTMKQGKREMLRVQLTRDAQGNLTLRLPPVRGEGEMKVPIGPHMLVKLSGYGFDLTPLTPEKQVVEPHGYTEWSFDVMPLESGHHSLRLAIGVRMKTPDGEEMRFHPVISRAIYVTFDPIFATKRFSSTNWQWLATAIIIPFIVWIWDRRERNALANAPLIHRPNVKNGQIKL